MDDLLQRIEQALRVARGPAATPPAGGAAPLRDGGPRQRAARLREGRGGGRAPLRAPSGGTPARPTRSSSSGARSTRRGDPFAAMTALEHAAEASPRHLPALRALAALYEESGFRRKAAEVLERALPAATTTRPRARAIRQELMRLIA